MNTEWSLADELEAYYEPRGRSRGARRASRPPSLHSLVAAVEWLNVTPLWKNGQIVWPLKAKTGESRLWRLAGADLARTERALLRLRKRAERVPGTVAQALQPYIHTSNTAGATGRDLCDAWLNQQQDNLGAAKKLLLLSAPDLSALIKTSHSRNPRNAERLAELLIAEALCGNPLPALPSQALVGFGALAHEPLWRQLADSQAPHLVRALAALVVGALDASKTGSRVVTANTPTHSAPVIAGDDWLLRSYRWGKQYGLPTNPALGPTIVVQILKAPDGTRHAEACLGALRAFPEAGDVMPASLLRRWLANGVAPALLPRLIASTRPLYQVLEQLRQRPELLPDKPKLRQRAAREVREQRQRLRAELVQQLGKYWLANPVPEIPALLATYMQALLRLGEWNSYMPEAIACPLRLGKTLSPPLQKAWLQILVDHHDLLWQEATREKDLAYRLHLCLRDRLRPAHTVLERSHDIQLTLELLRLELPSYVFEYEWSDVAIWYWLAELAREYQLNESPGDYWSICRMLWRFPTVAQAREAFGPLRSALAEQPLQQRKWTLLAILDSLVESDLHLLPRFAPYAVQLAGFAAQTTNRFRDKPDLDSVVEALVQLVKQPVNPSGDNASDDDTRTLTGNRLKWLLAHLLREEQREEPLPQIHRCGDLVDIACAIGEVHKANDWLWRESPAPGGAGEEVDPFAHLVRVGLQQANLPYHDRLKEGLKHLKHFPVLVSGLWLLFERQPLRCLRLLNDLGIALIPGESALAPLEPLRASLPEIAASIQHSAEWNELIRHTPQIEKPAVLYQFARRLAGDTATIPAGLQKQLEATQRMQRELAHLERLVDSERPGIAMRIANLRLRLQTPTALDEQIAAQAREKLLFIAGEAIVSATESLLQQCYRLRLEQWVGPVPETLIWSGDFTNAILMSFDIESNRRLLRRLLRAYVAGDCYWPQSHPANLDYMRKLRQRGINVEAWLSRFPRRYPGVPAQGSHVHLHLEQDPLRILQMGNHFGTCLSRGGCNSFSAVTNAVELNKRVIYALDATGRVVGRQLIGINENGELVGFHVYTSLSNEDANKKLRGTFRRYVESFAARCGLTLANEGTVPRLFAREWYDDGIIDWNDEDMVKEQKPAVDESDTNDTAVTTASSSPVAQSSGIY